MSKEIKEQAVGNPEVQQSSGKVSVLLGTIIIKAHSSEEFIAELREAEKSGNITHINALVCTAKRL